MPVADAKPSVPDNTSAGERTRQGESMRRFQEGERVRMTRTAGQILGKNNVSETVSRMPALGTIVGMHIPDDAGSESVYWRVRFDEIDAEAIVVDGDLMPLDHHPDSHTVS